MISRWVLLFFIGHSTVFAAQEVRFFSIYPNVTLSSGAKFGSFIGGWFSNDIAEKQELVAWLNDTDLKLCGHIEDGKLTTIFIRSYDRAKQTHHLKSDGSEDIFWPTVSAENNNIFEISFPMGGQEKLILSYEIDEPFEEVQYLSLMMKNIPAFVDSTHERVENHEQLYDLWVVPTENGWFIEKEVVENKVGCCSSFQCPICKDLPVTPIFISEIWLNFMATTDLTGGESIEIRGIKEDGATTSERSLVYSAPSTSQE